MTIQVVTLVENVRILIIVATKRQRRKRRRAIQRNSQNRQRIQRTKKPTTMRTEAMVTLRILVTWLKIERRQLSEHVTHRPLLRQWRRVQCRPPHLTVPQRFQPQIKTTSIACSAKTAAMACSWCPKRKICNSNAWWQMYANDNVHNHWTKHLPRCVTLYPHCLRTSLAKYKL